MKIKRFLSKGFFCIFCVLHTLSADTAAKENLSNVQSDKPAALQPWHLLGKNIGEAFWGTNTFFHLGAFATTATMVTTHADRKIQDYFIENNPLGQPFAFAMLRLGDTTSVILGLSFWGFGSWYDIPVLATAGAAAVQAVAINAAYVQTLKLITGRTRPGETNRDDDFFPGWQERVDNFMHRMSWPSGHTSSAFAFVATQHAFFPNEKWLPFIGYPIAAAIGIGMIEGDYHWASEVIAGAVIGTVIGYTTGKNFRTEYDRRKSLDRSEELRPANKALSFTVAPTVANGRYALSMVWSW